MKIRRKYFESASGAPMGQQRVPGGPREAPGGVSRPFRGPSAVVLAPTVIAANGARTDDHDNDDDDDTDT